MHTSKTSPSGNRTNVKSANRKPIRGLDLESFDQIRIHLIAMARVGRMHGSPFSAADQVCLSHDLPDPFVVDRSSQCALALWSHYDSHRKPPLHDSCEWQHAVADRILGELTDNGADNTIAD